MQTLTQTLSTPLSTAQRNSTPRTLGPRGLHLRVCLLNLDMAEHLGTLRYEVVICKGWPQAALRPRVW